MTIAQNNPMNMRPSPVPWQGQTGVVNGFITFDTPINGLRASAKQLLIYEDRHNCNTIFTIVSRWAPAADHNNVPAYVADVSTRMVTNQDAVLKLHDPQVMARLMMAMIWHECGEMPYTSAQLVAGIRDALA